MVRFSSPSLQVGGVMVASPYRERSEDWSDGDSDDDNNLQFSEMEEEKDDGDEEPHPLGFFSPTRFSLSVLDNIQLGEIPPTSLFASEKQKKYSSGRFTFFDDDSDIDDYDEDGDMGTLSRINRNSKPQEQRYPPLSSYISGRTAPTSSLVNYSIRKKHDIRNDSVDEVTELLRAASILHDSSKRRTQQQQWLLPPSQQTSETVGIHSIGENMFALANAASRELQRIRQEAEMERRKVEEEHRIAVDSLRMLLKRDENDACKVLIREKEEEEARQTAERIQREQEQKEAEEIQRQEQVKIEKQQKEEKERQRVKAEREAKVESERKIQEEKEKKKVEYIIRAKKLIAQLVEVRASVEPFEKIKSPHVNKRRLNMKKICRGKINTLSHDAAKITTVASEVSATILEARQQDDQIRQQLQSGNPGDLTREMYRGKRYLLDLLASNVIVRVQAESFNALKGDGFPLAAMLTAVSIEAKDLNPVLEAHIYTVCPTAIPTLPKIAPDCSEEDLMKSLGMLKDKNGSYETFEKFLARTEGIISIVADLQASKPANHTMMGGHEGAVKWLARFLASLSPTDNPLPLLTAPVLDAFLTGAGHMLANKYPEQFKKHLDIIINDTMTRLDEGTIGQPSSTRLKKLVAGGFDGFRTTLPPGAVRELYDGADNDAIGTTAGSTNTSGFSGSTGITGFGNNSFNTTSTPASTPASIPAPTQTSTQPNPFSTMPAPVSAPSKQDNRPLCQYFAKGNCRYGDKCRYSHETGGNSSGATPFSSGPTSAPAPAFGGFGNSTSNAPTPFGGGTAGGTSTAPGFVASSGSGASPFGQPTGQTTGFGASTGNSNPFGGSSNPSPFGGANSNPSPFGGGGGGGSSFGGTNNNSFGNVSNPFGGPRR